MADQEPSGDTPLIGLPAQDFPTLSRLLGVTMALASEVFVLKAENRRLTEALMAGGVLEPDQLEAVGEAEGFHQWMASEQKAFSSALLNPWLEPDAILDPRPFMSEGQVDSASNAKSTLREDEQ